MPPATPCTGRSLYRGNDAPRVHFAGKTCQGRCFQPRAFWIFVLTRIIHPHLAFSFTFSFPPEFTARFCSLLLMRFRLIAYTQMKTQNIESSMSKARPILVRNTLWVRRDGPLMCPFFCLPVCQCLLSHWTVLTPLWGMVPKIRDLAVSIFSKHKPPTSLQDLRLCHSSTQIPVFAFVFFAYFFATSSPKMYNEYQLPDARCHLFWLKQSRIYQIYTTLTALHMPGWLHPKFI